MPTNIIWVPFFPRLGLRLEIMSVFGDLDSGGRQRRVSSAQFREERAPERMGYSGSVVDGGPIRYSVTANDSE